MESQKTQQRVPHHLRTISIVEIVVAVALLGVGIYWYTTHSVNIDQPGTLGTRPPEGTISESPTPEFNADGSLKVNMQSDTNNTNPISDVYKNPFN